MKKSEYIEIKKLLLLHLKSKLSEEDKQHLDNYLSKNKPLKAFLKKVERKEFISQQYKLYKQFSAKDDWANVKKFIVSGKKRSIPLLITKWAAILIIPLAVATVFYMQKKEAVVDSPPAETKIDFQPGKSEAILILSGGKEFILGQNNNDTTLRDANTNISISKSKRIEYLPRKTAKTVSASAETLMNTLKVERGREYDLTLADGTKVWLNSETELKFPLSFNGKKREVYLKGEAYFQVAKNTQAPFIVHSNLMNVEVTGTSFNVMTYENEKDARVSLVKGQVIVRDQKGLEITLSPDQQAIVDNKGISIKEVNASLIGEWRNNSFGFEYEKLTSVVNKLSRWYNVDFVYADEDIKESHFSGKLPKYKNITEALDLLELTTNIKFKMADDKILIKKENR